LFGPVLLPHIPSRREATLRTIVTLLCLVLPLLAGAQPADGAAAAPKPRTFALVAAMGEGFNIVVEKASVGSHLAPFDRKRFESAGASVNALVLLELARQVSALDASARFVPMVYPVSPMLEVSAERRSQATFDAVVAELKQAPDRGTWDRNLIVTPAYRGPRKDGMASQLTGMGLFVEPLCVSDVFSCSSGVASLSGPVTQRPDGSMAPANGFFAPYFYATLWELDAASMEVIAKRDVFHHKKMSSDNDQVPAQIDASAYARINVQLANLVNQSIQDALKKTDLAGKVEVRHVKEVDPAEVGKPRP
jgi:hypothetical protein